ncbi:hypothetical protein [Micromonospora aurantiaca (nom. illeg.)]|uniref:hypothetical protein n=1 Tax=Micromonospora aurantiaca (nom. illeg.) TaxID=47850 RepID=UPI00364AAF23
MTDRGGRQRVRPFCFAFGLPLPGNLRGLARSVGSSLADDVDHLGAYGDAQCDPLEVSVVPDLQLEGVEQLPLLLVGQVEHVQINVR